MLNNVVLSMTRSRRQQHHHPPHHVAEEREEGGREGGTVSSSSSPFLMKPLRMLLLMLMVLSAAATYIQPSMAESETNDLNSLEPKEPVTMSLKPISAKLETRQHPNAAQYMPQSQLPATLPGCPLCDSSVYSYCSHKLIHDTCCCDYPGSIYQKPPQCVYYECSLLYAKSCYEHSLIKNCCCNNPY